MDIFKRSLSPITDEAWEVIQSQARTVLTAHLTARKFVDVSGPKGWDYAAEPIGRLDLREQFDRDGVRYGIRLVQPLVEARITFDLPIMELDNVTRGAKDIQLEPMEEAVKKIAHFEENAIYYGLENACIRGMYEASRHFLEFSDQIPEILEAVSTGITTLLEASVEGPYALVVNPAEWRTLSRHLNGYPLRRHIENLLGGPILYASEIRDAFLVSMRGGDLELILGQDYMIGYAQHDKDTVSLYLTESFTFRILDDSVFVKMSIKR